MASPSKRARTDAFERELEPLEIDCAEKNVTVHGVVTELSLLDGCSSANFTFIATCTWTKLLTDEALLVDDRRCAAS